VKACLADGSEAVRANGACMYCQLVSDLSEKGDRRAFTPFVPEVFQVLAGLAQLPDPKHVQAVLTTMQATAEVADIFKDHLGPHVLPVLCPIAKSHKENGARKLALEVLLCILENKTKMVLKTQGAASAILDIIFTFLMELDDDVEDWAVQDEDEAEAEENYAFGQEAINRLCTYAATAEAFDGVLQLLRPAIAQLLQQANWKGHVAGLAALAQSCEHIDDEATAEQMLTAVHMQLQSSHVRARYCAWGALQQFCIDQEDAMSSDKLGSVLLPEFIKGFDDKCTRVAAACMEAFHYFGEKTERETLEPFVQPLMGSLGARLQGQSSKLQREAITCIAVIAGQIEDGLAQYYAPLMPVLKQIISATLHKAEERKLLGKTFECISLLANVVGREAFRPDAEVIMQAMVQACTVPNLPKDDPVQEYVMAAAERLCSTLKEEFLPIVPHLLPGILAKCKLAPKEYDSSKDNLDDENPNLSLAITQGDDGEVKVLVVNTAELEDLGNALECMQTFAEKLGAHFTPFLAQTAQALLPVFDFNMSEQIRDAAFETWGHLLNCARKGQQASMLQELVQELLKRILPKLEKGDSDLEAQKVRADGVKVCLDRAGPGILGPAEVKHICQVALRIISESLARREQKPQGKSAPAAPAAEEDDKSSASGSEEEEELRTAACHMIIVLMEHHPAHFTAEGLPLLLQMVQKLIQPSCCDDDQHLAVLAAAGIFEHLGEGVAPHWDSFLPRVLQNMGHECPGLKGMAFYAASAAAKLQAFAPHAQATAQKAVESIQQARGQGKKKSAKPLQAAADNALSALVQVLLNHKAVIAAAEQQLWSTWLAGMPCQEDEQEGQRNNKILLMLMQQQHAHVVGEGWQNAPRLLSLLADAYKTDMCEAETSAAIAQMLLGMDDARLQQCAAALTEKQQKKLLRIRREAQTFAATA